MIIVQHTRQVWGKGERGAKFANIRAKFPVIASLPIEPNEQPMIVHRRGLHRLKMPGPYQEVNIAETVGRTNQYWSFDFKIFDNTLKAEFLHSYEEHGMPERRGFSSRMPIFQLGFGQTVQFMINGRHVYQSHTFYTRNVVNFAYGKFNKSVFSETKFKRVIDLESRLF